MEMALCDELSEDLPDAFTDDPPAITDLYRQDIVMTAAEKAATTDFERYDLGLPEQEPRIGSGRGPFGGDTA